MRKSRQGIYKRQLKSMVDNLTFGISGHPKRQTLKDFQETKSFKKEDLHKNNYRFTGRNFDKKINDMSPINNIEAYSGYFCRKQIYNVR